MLGRFIRRAGRSIHPPSWGQFIRSRSATHSPGEQSEGAGMPIGKSETPRSGGTFSFFVGNSTGNREHLTRCTASSCFLIMSDSLFSPACRERLGKYCLGSYSHG